jgi:hypothetical protein
MKYAHFLIQLAPHVKALDTPGRDIELTVVAPEFDGIRDRSNTDVLWALRATTDSRVEPIGVGERQWAEDDATPIIEIARKEGFEVHI